MILMILILYFYHRNCTQHHILYVNEYKVLFNEKINEACYLILNIRNGVYIAEKIDYKQRTIRIIALTVDIEAQMKNGLQQNIVRTNYTSIQKKVQE